ncbi:FecR domain-containing protein [Nodosilinea sp. LEGE 06152]|uniref:FecR domain-containing protein n=1 Tax=Nodosilinea sp. LEGE 06152 TaxID=2777966 RepID=UPI00187DEBB9|nr:FecR domain-containing protein [Nodosilinea sp. LEGE 06152]MBE9157823.1 FecR domain-containing protein [Nodosilinea sp. LEGE 06152]
MVFRTDNFLAMLLATVGSVAIASPALAEVPWTWAKLSSSTNQVSLLSAGGVARPAAVADCFCPGETLSTSTMARAEALFNDGSLTRLGEQASLRFWPDTRNLYLSRGTAAVFVPPGQGRTTVQTANATVGLNSTAVVVRYVPSRQLTLVMALATAPTGPVLVTDTSTGQEFALYGGQMAFVNGANLQIVEFDLLEFYQTSDLMADLKLGDPTYRPPAGEPLSALRPNLMEALAQQAPFVQEGSILDPALISDIAPVSSPQGVEDGPLNSLSPVEELRRYNDAPPGVVNPLPEAPAAPPTAAPAAAPPAAPVALPAVTTTAAPAGLSTDPAATQPPPGDASVSP